MLTACKLRSSSLLAKGTLTAAEAAVTSAPPAGAAAVAECVPRTSSVADSCSPRPAAASVARPSSNAPPPAAHRALRYSAADRTCPFVISLSRHKQSQNLYCKRWPKVYN